MTRYNTFRLLYLFLLLIYGCKSNDSSVRPENCPEEVALEKLFVLENSFSFLPYNEEMSAVIFIDSFGFELKLNLEKSISNTEMPFTKTISCPEDEIFSSTYSRYVEQHCFKLNHVYEAIDFEICTEVEIDRNDEERVLQKYRDVLTVYEIPVSSNPLALLHIDRLKLVIDKRNWEGNGTTISYKEELTLNNRVFTDVYHGRISLLGEGPFTDSDDFYYNNEFGLLQFKDKNGKVFTFDRIE